jgi:superfamily II DNA or RNA helicase
MDGVARVSQRITKQCGHLIRIEAARTDEHQSPYQPLQAYMDMDNIGRHVEPWQRILMFFARTQQPHEWSSPRYRLMPRQQRAWQALWRCAQSTIIRPSPGRTSEEPEPYQLTSIQRACMDFCIELLNQRVGAEEYECALVCALAVLGRSRDGWQTVESYPPILSKIIKIARFMVLHKALRLDPHADEIVQFLQHRHGVGEWWSQSPMDDPEYSFAGQDEGYTSRSPTPTPEPDPSVVQHVGGSPVPELISFTQQRQQRSRPFREWLKLLVDTFLVRGTHGPMQWMLDLRTYGLRVHYNTTTPGHIAWMGPDQLLYKEVHFTIGDFRGFVHGLIGSLQGILRDELLITTPSTPIPSIPWDSLMDDPGQAKAGWNFLYDSRTKWPVDGTQWMLQRLTQDDPVQRQFINTHEQQFRTSAIHRYMQRVVRFREQLCIAIHVTAGQPSRAPELLSIRHRNTEGGHRNIFIEDGLVVFASRYHKGFYAQNDAKTIHRYLPREVGELVVWYLWLVLPFVERFQAFHAEQQSYDHTSRTSQAAYLWPPDPHTGREWTSDRFREVLKRETAIGLHGYSLNIPAYRDIAIGISRRFLRVSSVFPHNVQDGRTTEGSPDDVDDESQMDHDQFMGHIADLQAAHSSHVAGMIYGREVSEQAGTTAHRREMFRLSSTDWHRFLGFSSSEDPLARVLGKRKRSPWESIADEARSQRRYQLRETNMTEAVRQMTGDHEIQFRGVQGPAMRAIQHGASPVVVVMPTGGGKSILFMLPAWVAGGLTVVVVPLITLRADLQDRCTTLGIPCVAWESRRPPDEASIVLVTPESVLSTEFTTFLNRQRMMQRLDRIVIDECHVLLHQDTTFRPMMQQLGRLVAAQTQLVLLTATLPPSAEGRLWQQIRCERSQVELYRGRTSRTNIAYRVWRPVLERGMEGPNQWIQMPQVMAFVRQRIQRVPAGRVIVYGSTTTHVGIIAGALGCDAFYSGQDDKSGIIERFRQGHTGVIVATSALGMGIDIPDIRCVIHIGWPRTMLDYAQESGRAGRDGQASEAIIIQPEGINTAPPWMVPEPTRTGLPESEEPRRVYDYITAGVGQCRRVMLDTYLDGTVDGYQRVRCGDGPPGLNEAPCDRCEPGWQAIEPETSEMPMINPVVRPRRPIKSIPRRITIPARPSHIPPSIIPSPPVRPTATPREPPGAPRPVRVTRRISITDEIDFPPWPVRDPPVRRAVGEPVRDPGPMTDSSYPRVSFSRSESIQSQVVRTTPQRPSPIPPPVRHPSPDVYDSDQSVISSESESVPSPVVRTTQRSPSPVSSEPVDDPASPRIPLHIQHEFRQQDIHRAGFQRTHRQQGQQDLQEQEVLEAEAQRWHERCWICTQDGREAEHDLYSCWAAGNRTAKQWFLEWRSKIRYEPYTGCYRCGMPQVICQGYASGARPCVYRGMLMSMWAMMIYGEPTDPAAQGVVQRVRELWRQRLISYEVDPDDAGQVVQFLGRECERRWMRQTELVMEFIWLRDYYGEYGM